MLSYGDQNCRLHNGNRLVFYTLELNTLGLKMNSISIGAVGAAIIAGFFSIVSLIIGKEQKTSEFRQAWIDALRADLVSYLVNINAICDMLRIKKNGEKIDFLELMKKYQYLNEANLGITLRINPSENTAKALLKTMSEFDEISQDNTLLTPDRIKKIEEEFLLASKNLLKFEWKRVKNGEKGFIITRNCIIVFICLMILFMVFLLIFPQKSERKIELHTNVEKIFSPKNLSI